ncbi:50S ribosomal protein L11 methyltransferase [Jiulongibacter sediminis]|uniref:Ribosomal protein L11 methyltransferase n=1 Tax=Jiulongibacter sediminis TaxID=1605367 RepID=A0A0P7BS76_9BACT|nr:50S ribosomal protein L11 methyltransferase [Jiulongibacter sediminis]KPM47286.1 50S ribosomal protein L11 methyltransferase [Jiulongibacter sediminis]TBX22844.1 50S ribosomal protein L11 methyltransferase [Jiulongibacter sediminis]
MNYFEATIEVNADFAEILIAELAEIGFDTFLENDNGLQAYITEELFDDQAFKLLMEDYSTKTSLFYSIKGIEKQNWNAEWEKSFDPIEVNDQIRVRATFHEAKEGVPYEIIITPKMSFGTGHHETTAQVMQLQLEVDHQKKKVLDVGTGTGILAILAEKLGAGSIRAFDIDEWSVENTLENIELNNCYNISVGQGTIKDETKEEYDIVIANINRNILLEELSIYSTFLKKGGILMLSGFYEKDGPDIEAECNNYSLKKVKLISKKDWAAVVYTKQ